MSCWTLRKFPQLVFARVRPFWRNKANIAQSLLFPLFPGASRARAKSPYHARVRALRDLLAQLRRRLARASEPFRSSRLDRVLRLGFAGFDALMAAPWPSAFNFQHQRPAQEGADQDEAGENTETGEGRLQRHGLDDVRGDQDFEPKQQSAADAHAILVVASVCRASVKKAHRRPDDANHDDDHAENVDRDAHDADPVADGGFERDEFVGRVFQGGLYALAGADRGLATAPKQPESGRGIEFAAAHYGADV